MKYYLLLPWLYYTDIRYCTIPYLGEFWALAPGVRFYNTVYRRYAVLYNTVSRRIFHIVIWRIFDNFCSTGPIFKIFAFLKIASKFISTFKVVWERGMDYEATMLNHQIFCFIHSLKLMKTKVHYCCNYFHPGLWQCYPWLKQWQVLVINLWHLFNHISLMLMQI